jgi:glycoprotein-N-acetylgalactosamine 3-beta-galactosyltransferase
LTGYHYSGYNIPYEIKHGHVSGGSGYTLSRDTLKFLVEVLPNKTICPGGWAEDKEVAICLANVGIYPENTKDENGINRFIPSHPNYDWYQLLNPDAVRLPLQ